jgi:hypothetical protein
VRLTPSTAAAAWTTIPGVGEPPPARWPCISPMAPKWQATSDEEQAVSTVMAGPLRPKVKDRRPLVTDRWAPGQKGRAMANICFNRDISN